jgi:ABC-2 type transport system ATP-binding protein
MRDLIAAASGNQVTLHTTARDQAARALQQAGAAVTGAAHGALIITGLPAEQVVVLLNDSRIPFAEVSAHRASLEDAYLRLTQDAVEFRAEVPGTRAGEAAR